MDSAQSGDAPQGNTHDTTDEPQNSTAKRKWRRNRIACDACHSRRVRCDRAFPCSRCLRSDIHCEFTRERRKRGRIARSKQNNTNGTTNKSPTAVPNRRISASAAAVTVATPAQNGSPSSSFPHRSPATNDMTVSAPSVDDRRSQAEVPLPPRKPGLGGNVTEEWLSGAH
ncbi:hypothetical protein BBP40_010412, partial [Aspergillus hancockii]